MAKFDLKQYARRGAEARVAELTAELSEIYRTFPDLRRRGAGAGPARGGRSASADGNASPKRKRKMSAAQRRAVSQRMKRYWAEQRKTKQASR